MSEDFNLWMRRVANGVRGVLVREGGIYAGVDGCLRLARECGPALLDFEDGEKNIGSTYSGICVIAYDLRPPVDAGEWLNSIREGMERAKQYDMRYAHKEEI